MYNNEWKIINVPVELVTFVLASPNDGELMLLVVNDELLPPVTELDTVDDLQDMDF